MLKKKKKRKKITKLPPNVKHEELRSFYPNILKFEVRIITDMMKNQESDYEKKDRRVHVTFATCYHRGGFSNWKTGQVDDSKNTLKYI